MWQQPAMVVTDTPVAIHRNRRGGVEPSTRWCSPTRSKAIFGGDDLEAALPLMDGATQAAVARVGLKLATRLKPLGRMACPRRCAPRSRTRIGRHRRPALRDRGCRVAAPPRPRARRRHAAIVSRGWNGCGTWALSKRPSPARRARCRSGSPTRSAARPVSRHSGFTARSAGSSPITGKQNRPW